MLFAEPPASVKIKGGGATRSVLSGAGDLPPKDILPLLKDDAERRQLIQAHAKWDGNSASHVREWKALAEQ